MEAAGVTTSSGAFRPSVDDRLSAVGGVAFQLRVLRELIAHERAHFGDHILARQLVLGIAHDLYEMVGEGAVVASVEVGIGAGFVGFAPGPEHMMLPSHVSARATTAFLCLGRG